MLGLDPTVAEQEPWETHTTQRLDEAERVAI
jgi:hypothetical protein